MKNYCILLLLFLTITSCKTDSKTQENNTEASNAFTWDFDEPKKYVYDFSQQMKSVSKINEVDPPKLAHLNASGILNVLVKDNKEADFSLTDMRSELVSFNRQGKNDTIRQNMPPSVMEGMKPDGTFEKLNNLNILYDIVFPLPATNIKQGEEYKRPMFVPFNVGSNLMRSKGFNTLKYVETKTVNGIECAVLKGTIDVSDLEIPIEFTGDYGCSTTGEATYYFSTKNGHYVGADIKTTMEFFINAKQNPATKEINQNSKMKSDVIYSIKLKEIVPIKTQE